MTRLIDADELEKKLAGYFTGDRGGEATMRELITDETIADSIRIIREQPTVEALQWIPVSERLPDFGVDVLVCDGEGVQVTAKRTWWSTDPNGWATNYCGYDYDSWDFMTNGDIVAWMELPKPFKRKV